MESIGRLHSEESCFSTWSVVGEALSNALLPEPDGLYLQSTTKIHRKDFLLFTRKNDARADGTRGILEIDFTQKLEEAKWQCHWQQARPQFVHVVKTCKLSTRTGFATLAEQHSALEQFFRLEDLGKQAAAQSEQMVKDGN